MREKTVNALIEMGMPAGIKGFNYIVDIMCLFKEEEYRKCKTTALYEKVGKMNNTTASGVERAIRHAFGIVLSKGDLKAVEKYLTTQHPTNGNLLHVLYLKLVQE